MLNRVSDKQIVSMLTIAVHPVRFRFMTPYLLDIAAPSSSPCCRNGNRKPLHPLRLSLPCRSSP